MSKNETGRESPRTKLRRVLRFMKKTLKKFAAVGLSLTSVMGLVACGSNSGNQDATKATVDWANVQKPEQFTVMVDGTVVKETNGAQEFYKYLGDLTGLDIKWIRPEHSSYYDSVKNAFASGDIPDVVLLSSDYLAIWISPPSSIVSMKYLKIPSALPFSYALYVIHQAVARRSLYVPSSLIGLIAIILSVLSAIEF